MTVADDSGHALPRSLAGDRNKMQARILFHLLQRGLCQPDSRDPADDHVAAIPHAMNPAQVATLFDENNPDTGNTATT
jgi:hypothetical protein